MFLSRNINPTHRDISDYVTLPDGKIVHRFAILTTSLVHYDVWEPSKMMGAHSTITVINGSWYGSVTSRPLPAELDALTPGSEGRIKAVTAWQDANYALAEALIKATFPQDFA